MADTAILLAAGNSTRMGRHVEDKILAPIAGKPVVLYSLQAFVRSGAVDEIVMVYRDEPQRSLLANVIDGEPLGVVSLRWTQGGVERQDSVWNALEDIREQIGNVYIHDCARPLIRVATLTALQKALSGNKAVCLAHRLSDTILKATPEATSSHKGRLEKLDRDRLWAMETPQVFERRLITEAYRKVRLDGRKVTDDASAAIWAGHEVTLVENPHPNIKLTVPEDLAYAEFLLKAKGPG